jgi:hypothetical protein
MTDKTISRLSMTGDAPRRPPFVSQPLSPLSTGPHGQAQARRSCRQYLASLRPSKSRVLEEGPPPALAPRGPTPASRQAPPGSRLTPP